MLALTFQGERSIRLETVPLPQLQDDTSAIVKVLLCSICGRCGGRVLLRPLMSWRGELCHVPPAAQRLRREPS
jgi:hypothetical protein